MCVCRFIIDRHLECTLISLAMPSEELAIASASESSEANNNEQQDEFPFFEGCEKRLEIVFSDTGDKQGLRRISKDEWNGLLAHAHCTILGGCTSSETLDSYILSESSLFVSPLRVVIKTCGTTSLLQIVPVLVTVAEKLGASLETVFFSHQNYMFPERQPAPHHNLEAETQYLHKHFDGELKTLGSKDDGFHWSLFTNNRSQLLDETPVHSLHSLEIMMHQLDPEVMKQFHHSEETPAQVIKRTGITDILLNAEHVDGHVFQPWGFSMNALKDDVYITIHVTPEDGGSYVSYETNMIFRCLETLKKTIQRVIDLFKPSKFCCVVAHEDPTLRDEESFLEVTNYVVSQSDFLLVDKRGFHFFEFFVKE